MGRPAGGNLWGSAHLQRETTGELALACHVQGARSNLDHKLKLTNHEDGCFEVPSTHACTGKQVTSERAAASEWQLLIHSKANVGSCLGRSGAKVSSRWSILELCEGNCLSQAC